MEKNTGIILKTCQNKNRIAFVLDYNLGKVKCIPNNDNIITGSLVNYGLKNNKTPYLIESIELLHVPFIIANNDILFLHHVLEICDLFLAFENKANEIFDILIYLYKNENQFLEINKKKLFLLKLFTLFGLYPEEVEFQTSYFHNLAIESIDKIMTKNLDLNSIYAINKWLIRCISTQQEFSKIKTINFLYKN